MNIHIENSRFVDDHGRQVLLRGVNLGGSSKVPFQPDGATYIHAGFFDHRKVSFVGRPFPSTRQTRTSSDCANGALTSCGF